MNGFAFVIGMGIFGMLTHDGLVGLGQKYRQGHPISQDEIKSAYKEFDDMYEEAEIPPYNAAYNYFEAGVRYAEKHYRHA